MHVRLDVVLLVVSVLWWVYGYRSWVLLIKKKQGDFSLVDGFFGIITACFGPVLLWVNDSPVVEEKEEGGSD